MVPIEHTQRVLLISDRSPWSRMAAEAVARRGMSLTHLCWERGDPPPGPQVTQWRGDWILGFKADYIVPREQLARAGRGALNFHPGPPSVRGVGVYDVAVEQRQRSFGVTCHHMAERVDAGPIIQVRRFPLRAGTNAAELSDIAAAELLALFVHVVHLIAGDESLPVAPDTWSGPLHTWREFDQRMAHRPA